MINSKSPNLANDASPKNSIFDVLTSISSGFFADFKSMSIQVACLRVFRRAKFLFMPKLYKQLLRNAAYQSHIEKVDENDSIFFLAHRYYLAKGLTGAQRSQIALHHYEHEMNSFDQDYYENVYRGQGLMLWSTKVDDIVFDIRLMPGNDVLYEGACSIVFHINGERICVVSYTLVPLELFLPTHSTLKNAQSFGKSIFFVSRKQSTGDHAYQKDFNRVFDRTTPVHLCFGAFTAIAIAQGHSSFIGISPEIHPSIRAGLEKFFDVAYSQFWDSLDGKKISPYGYLMELPMSMTSLDVLDAKARKRAIARRQHIDNVYVQASTIIQKNLLDPNLISSSQVIATTTIVTTE